MQPLTIFPAFLGALPMMEEIYDKHKYVILLFLKEHSKRLQRKLHSLKVNLKCYW